MTRILCVCLGNICRSPTAEAVLRQNGSARFQVDSAGTGDWHVGNPPHEPAIRAASARGYDLNDLRARRVKIQDFDHFDLILAMDAQNLADLEALRPKGNKTPVKLMMSYVPNTATDAVPDPYYTGDFEGTLDLIETAAASIIKSLD